MHINGLRSLPSSVVVFGAGEGGSFAASELSKKGVMVKSVFDNDSSKWGGLLDKQWNIEKPWPTNELIAIGSIYAIDIAKQLKNMDCSYTYYGPCFDRDRFFFGDLPRDEIQWLTDEMQDPESLSVLSGLLEFRQTADPLSLFVSSYDLYQHPMVKARADMVIVDGGAWEGDTAENFLEQTNNRCTVVCFEPDEKSLAAIDHGNVLKVAKGLFSRDGSVGFATGENSSQSHVVDEIESANKIDVIQLDTFKAEFGHPIDLIKLDIEGAERNAIIGSSNVLSGDAPDLMISLYHRYDDLWVIPLLIKEINPDYRFFLGHHSQYLFDTVLYASVRAKG